MCDWHMIIYGIYFTTFLNVSKKQLIVKQPFSDDNWHTSVSIGLPCSVVIF